MILFGVDPGTSVTGYGVIRAENNTVSWVDSGTIKPCSNGTLADKLFDIFHGLEKKIREFSPTSVCVEQAFYAKNVRTTLILGHARGVALLAARCAGAHIMEFTPRVIKKSIVGNGNAGKDQVTYMVKMLLSPAKSHSHADAYDALAVALCGMYHLPFSNRAREQVP